MCVRSGTCASSTSKKRTCFLFFPSCVSTFNSGRSFSTIFKTVCGTETMEKNGNVKNVTRVVVTEHSEFQYKLYRILDVGHHEDLIRWQDHGVRINDNERFGEEILKEWYGYGEKAMKFSSFRRQLNRYGFHTETRTCPINNNRYFYFRSENFQQGSPESLAKMQPKKKPRVRRAKSAASKKRSPRTL